jgi:hypothetical protein
MLNQNVKSGNTGGGSRIISRERRRRWNRKWFNDGTWFHKMFDAWTEQSFSIANVNFTKGKCWEWWFFLVHRVPSCSSRETDVYPSLLLLPDGSFFVPAAAASRFSCCQMPCNQNEASLTISDASSLLPYRTRQARAEQSGSQVVDNRFQIGAATNANAAAVIASSMPTLPLFPLQLAH